MTIHSVLIQKLLSTNAHMGRRLVTDPFKIYTHGMRNKLAIIDSDRTLICLRSALSFISSLARQNSQVLFVNTNPLHDEIVSCMASTINNPHFISKNALWKMGGVLTNPLNPKKFKSRKKKLCFGPVVPPDCVIVMDRERKCSILNEASRVGIPAVALVDPTMPAELFEKIAYPIPANESAQFVYLFCNLITKTFLKEQRHLKGTNSEREEEILQIEKEVPQIEKEVPQIEKEISQIEDFAVNTEAPVLPSDE